MNKKIITQLLSVAFLLSTICVFDIDARGGRRSGGQRGDYSRRNGGYGRDRRDSSRDSSGRRGALIGVGVAAGLAAGAAATAKSKKNKKHKDKKQSKKESHKESSGNVLY